MHAETYSAFFTPRDKEPSLSSFEEKSSEFDWLERKRMRKQKYVGKIEQVLCKIYFLQNCTKDASSSSVLRPLLLENRLPRAIYKENYKTKYLRLFTHFPNLITKESYNWWVTRRKWGFIHQKSEAKYPKVSVANIGKLQEKFCCTV